MKEYKSYETYCQPCKIKKKYLENEDRWVCNCPASCKTCNSINVHFSSKTDEWETPQDFFDKLEKEFYFTTDVCATKENAKCKDYITKAMDGLSMSWDNQTIWCNPPW